MKTALLVMMTAACALPGTTPVADDPVVSTLDAAEERDFVKRLAEAMASPGRASTDELLGALERLLPAWRAEQRRLQEGPIENLVTLRVVTHFDQVLEAYRTGNRDRRLVAAWALGFSRVPGNDLGIASPHAAARDALAASLRGTDDEVLLMALLGLWKLGDPETPIEPLADLMVQHHSADVRANAALTLGTVLTGSTAGSAIDTVLVGLADSDSKVRLHASSIARRFPHSASTARIEQLLVNEPTPLVRAGMATALGAARAHGAAPLLVGMLASPREIESASARQALTEIFGVDRGADPAGWADLLP